MNQATASADAIASELLFSTPVFTQMVPEATELNAYLRELFLARERAESQDGRKYSNVGGWHSPIDLQESWDPDLRLILEKGRDLATEATNRLLDAADRMQRYRYALSAWANVSRAGNYNVPHVHMATWAAVYYISVPPTCGQAQSGGLELLDPRPATAMLDMPGSFFATRRLIQPREGLLVLFPASVMHFVHPFQGPGERISIASDLTFEPL
jgi:uncharacterized protein (TIGR02466 family)